MGNHTKSCFGIFCPHCEVPIVEVFPHHAYMFTAKLMVIGIAAGILVDCIPTFPIISDISDSKGVLHTLNNCLAIIHGVCIHHSSISCLWISCHEGSRGNKQADQLTKLGRHL
ncbi:hypothetical protein Trydic_g11501 [Trypoxylus dichotomus]